MNRELVYKETKIQYRLNIRKNARAIRLSVYPDGRVLVSGPKRIGIGVIDNFVMSKAEWIYARLKKIKNNPPRFLLKGTVEEFRMYKQRARNIAEERVKYFSKLYGFRYNRISIRNTRTRWGSCSKAGNLNFSYKIALLPEHLRDYVIAHELCHLKEFNHSSGFWQLLETVLPGSMKAKEELKSLERLNKS